MDDAHKELVKRLHGGKCPQCYGFGEVSYGGELVRCSCLGKYEAPISMEHRKAAADALEVMAGEVERLKVAIEYNGRQCIDTMNKMHKQHAAERDRLAGEVARLKEERDAAITDRFDAAADRIKAVAAERDRLAKSEEGLLKTLGLERREKHAAQTERDRLKAALQDCVDAYDFVIVNEYDRGWSSVSDAIHAARKALGGDA